MNGGKVVENLAHAAIMGSMAYLATHPDSAYLWLIPAISWLGQCMDAPDITLKDATPPAKAKPALPAAPSAPSAPNV